MEAKKTLTRIKFGKRLRMIRLGKVKELRTEKISQEELGFRSGLHRTYVGAIERGEQNISIDNIHKLAKALKISVKDLL